MSDYDDEAFEVDDEGYDEDGNLDDDEGYGSILVLADEDGNEVEFEFLDYLEHEGRDYVILLPLDEDDASEVVILEVRETDLGEAYASVDDEATIDMVYALFKERNADLFDFDE